MIDGKPQAQMNRHFILSVSIKSFDRFNKVVTSQSKLHDGKHGKNNMKRAKSLKIILVHDDGLTNV